jgi:hypothetical protein
VFWGWIAACFWDAAVICGATLAVSSNGGDRGGDLGLWEAGFFAFRWAL